MTTGNLYSKDCFVLIFSIGGEEGLARGGVLSYHALNFQLCKGVKKGNVVLYQLAGCSVAGNQCLGSGIGCLQVRTPN